MAGLEQLQRALVSGFPRMLDAPIYGYELLEPRTTVTVNVSDAFVATYERDARLLARPATDGPFSRRTDVDLARGGGAVLEAASTPVAAGLSLCSISAATSPASRPARSASSLRARPKSRCSSPTDSPTARSRSASTSVITRQHIKRI